jgi:hypothetical protein
MRSRNTDFQNFLIGLAIQSYTKATIMRLTQKKKRQLYCVNIVSKKNTCIDTNSNQFILTFI